MKIALFLYRAAAFLILLSIVVFFLGCSLGIVFESFYWNGSSDVVFLSAVLMAVSVPFALACLIASVISGLIYEEQAVIALVASLFFWVFGYIASVFTLGYTIKREIMDVQPDNEAKPINKARD